MNRVKYSDVLVACVVGATLSIWPVAHAQSSDEERLQENVLEEVIVTAQRTAENIQDVPIAISALTSEALEDSDTHNLEGIANQVPGLTFSPFSPAQNIVSLRGASSTDDGAGTDSSVAIFVDDVYMGRISNINPEMFDLERVEVLRGPQGTLYGKNTIGGAINVISKRPSKDAFEGKVRFTVGNYNAVVAQGYVSGPLSDSLAGKVAFSSRTRDGFSRNVTLDRDQRDDNASGMRMQLLYDNDDDLSILFSFDQNDLDIDDQGRVALAADYDPESAGNPAKFRAGHVAACGDSFDQGCVSGIVDGYAKRDASGFSAKVEYRINDNLNLTSITATRTSSADWNMDSTGSPGPHVNDDILDDTDQFSQEFRLSGSPSEALSYVAGLWLLTEETTRTECFDRETDEMGDCSIVHADGTNDGSDYYSQSNETSSFALFGQVNYQLTERLRLTAGGRYSSEDKSIDNTTLKGDFVVINETFSNSKSASWSKFTPRLSLNYDLSDTATVYATFSEGFKSGGFPGAPQSEAESEAIDQEEATNIEFGYKADINSNLRLALAYFDTEYDGLQVQSFGPRPDCVGDSTQCFGVFRTFNAGSATISGVELELDYLASRSVTIGGFISTLDSAFGETSVPNSLFSNQQGLALWRAPELKYGVNVIYDYAFASGSSLRVWGNYSYTDLQRAGLAPYSVQPAYSLLDLSVAWRDKSGKLEAKLWSKNALDEAYLTHVYTISASATGVFGSPQTAGVTVNYSF